MKRKGKIAFNRIPADWKYDLSMEGIRSAADDFILPYCQNSGLGALKLLEINPSEGYLKYFCDTGSIKFYAAESKNTSREICQRLGYTLLDKEPGLIDLSLIEDNFDILVLNHFLESHPNPSLVMKEVHRLLKEDGIAILKIRTYPFFIANLINFTINIFPKSSLRPHYFSLRSLKKLLQRFEIKDIRGFRLFPFYVSTRLEDNFQYYYINTWWGKKFASLTPEVNIVLQKRNA